MFYCSGFPININTRKTRKADFYPDNNKLEVIWTVVPAVVLALLVIGGWKAWSDITAPAPENAHVVELWDISLLGK
jgi:cytochrome c oxidase subunit II